MTTMIDVPTNATLPELEEALTAVHGDSSGQIEVRLPRNIGPVLFKESRVAALLATAAASRVLTVRDWIQEDLWRRSRPIAGFQDRIEGLATLVYGSFIGAIAGETVKASVDEVAESLIARRGFLEPFDPSLTSRASTSALTLCALDEECPEPLVLAGIHSRDKFVDEFTLIRRRYLDDWFGEAKRTRKDADDSLAAFVFELFENGFEHGRLDAKGRIMRGLRYVRLRKHIGIGYNDFVRRASGFAELEAYISNLQPSRFGSRSDRFIEISISDHGLGIVSRFLATRPEFSPERHGDDSIIQLVNRIIGEALSSKINQPGAGYGLRRALEAVAQLRGFLSLRTGTGWLYYSGQAEQSQGSVLAPVRVAERLSPIVGTHFNMLFPVVQY